MKSPHESNTSLEGGTSLIFLTFLRLFKSLLKFRLPCRPTTKTSLFHPNPTQLGPVIILGVQPGLATSNTRLGKT